MSQAPAAPVVPSFAQPCPLSIVCMVTWWLFVILVVVVPVKVVVVQLEHLNLLMLMFQYVM